MDFKLSQKVKDIFDVIRAVGSYLAILTIAFSLYFTISFDDIDLKKIPDYLIIAAKALAIILVFFPIILYLFDRIKLRYIIIRGNLSGYIIEKQEVIIDIFDEEGKDATFFQKIFFHKFSNKTRNQYLTKIDVSGKIIAKTIQSLNCFYSLNKEQNSLSISYVNNMKKLNKSPNFFKENDKFIMLYTSLKDTFMGDEENWDMDVLNLCQDYSLQIILPKNKSLKYAKFVRTNNPDEIIKDIQPLIIKENERQKIVLRVMNFDKNESFSLRWSLN